METGASVPLVDAAFALKSTRGFGFRSISSDVVVVGYEIRLGSSSSQLGSTFTHDPTHGWETCIFGHTSRCHCRSPPFKKTFFLGEKRGTVRFFAPARASERAVLVASGWWGSEPDSRTPFRSPVRAGARIPTNHAREPATARHGHFPSRCTYADDDRRTYLPPPIAGRHVRPRGPRRRDGWSFSPRTRCRSRRDGWRRWSSSGGRGARCQEHMPCASPSPWLPARRRRRSAPRGTGRDASLRARTTERPPSVALAPAGRAARLPVSALPRRGRDVTCRARRAPTPLSFVTWRGPRPGHWAVRRIG